MPIFPPSVFKLDRDCRRVALDFGPICPTATGTPQTLSRLDRARLRVLGSALRVVELYELLLFGRVVHELTLRYGGTHRLRHLCWRFPMPRAKIPELTAFANPLLRGPRDLARPTPKTSGDGT